LAAGYRVHLLFLGLRDTELSEVRVKERWQSGGHYVDPQTVADNFYGNLEKLNRHYQMFNTVHIIDTSDAEHIVLTIFDKGQPALSIPSKDLPRWFRNDLPDITHKIEEEEVGRELL
jgi:predicted ABC-type ATPase